MSPYGSYLLETILTLAGVCTAAFALLYGARRLGVGRASGALELLGRLPIDARRSIVLVKIGETVFVVGVGDGGMTKLGELAAADVPAGVAVESRGFPAVLARVVGRARPPSGAPARVEEGARGEEGA